MKWSPVIPFHNQREDDAERRNDEDKDPTVRFLQGGLILTLLLWGILALSIFAEPIHFILDSYERTITALGTVAIALFTFTLWVTTSRTLKQLEREFLATHRPRLKIRQVEFNGADSGHVDFVIANAGDADAILTEVVTADWDGDPYISHPSVPRDIRRIIHLAEVPQEIGAGETWNVKHEPGPSDSGNDLRTRFQNRVTAKGGDDRPKPIMFLCVIRYTDALGAPRKTATFRWLFEQPPTTRFMEVGFSPDENYED
jgi:hypothetical protein